MPEQENNILFLVDGSSLAFRSFFALLTTGMRNAEGLPTWAVYGFFASLFDLIEKHSPHSLAVCFDMAEPTFRHEQFEDYKAHRDEMPDDLQSQWPIIKDAVKALSIPLYELAGWEADDIIGTLAKRARTRDLKTVILTGDQDAFQLLDDHIQVLMPTKEGLKTYGRQEVYDKLSVWPEQIIDYKGLCGDTSDNIPGVKGIGPKTAVTLLGQYQTIEGIYEHIEEIKSASQKNKLIEGKDSAFSSKDLATIRLDVPLEFDFDHCQMSCPEPEKIAEIFRNLELRNLLKRLPKVLSHFNNGVAPQIDPELLQVASRSRMKSGAANTPDRILQTTQAEPVAAGRQLSLLDAAALSSESQSSATLTQVESPKYEILRNAAEIQALKQELSESGLFCMAIRAGNEHPLLAEVHGLAFTYSQALEKDELGRLSFKQESDLKRLAYVPLQAVGEGPCSRQEVLEILKPLLEEKSCHKIVFDAKYFANVLSLHKIELQGVIFDAMLASYILNPDENHKLRDQSSSILGRRLPELPPSSPRKPLDLDFLPLSQLAELSCEELKAIHDLCLAYMKAMDEDQRELLWGMDLPLASVLAKMEQNGVRLDLPYFKSLAKELNGEIARLEKEIHELAGHPFNVGSPLQLQKVLFEELKLPAKVKTKSGYSTDANVLEGLVDQHAIVAKILEWRHMSKLSSTYVEALPKLISERDSRLHGEFNQTVTSTGRLSSTSPNLQNIPIRTEIGRRIRGGFIAADDDSQIISADYSQIELRLLAHMSGDEKLIEAFKNNEDIHARTASLIFELPVDEVTDEQRRIGKTLNFALIYQQGAFATGQSLGISTKEAQGFIEKYFLSFPKVRNFMNRVIADARTCGYVQTLWGRRRYFSHLNDRNEGIRRADERAAFNAPLQGSAADLMKLAMIKLQDELEARQMKSRLILQVHDELVLDVPLAELELAKEVLHSAMTMGEPLQVPLKVDIGSGKNWMSAK
ncbi:MAG: DNA polymerase I [Candidatus Obscuribacterales bacterium]|nr:DNA polymerase I [Candidatus Obscuribacterales bacterium]